MPYSPLTHDSVFLHVFGEPEGLPLLESLVNAHFEAVGLPLVHNLVLQPRNLPPEHDGEKLALVDILAEDATGRIVNVEVQTTRKPAYFENVKFGGVLATTTEPRSLSYARTSAGPSSRATARACGCIITTCRTLHKWGSSSWSCPSSFARLSGAHG